MNEFNFQIDNKMFHEKLLNNNNNSIKLSHKTLINEISNEISKEFNEKENISEENYQKQTDV